MVETANSFTVRAPVAMIASMFERIGIGLFVSMLCAFWIIVILTMPLWFPFWCIGWVWERFENTSGQDRAK